MITTFNANYSSLKTSRNLELIRRCQARFRRLGVSQAVPCPIWARIMDELDERLMLLCGRVRAKISQNDLLGQDDDNDGDEGDDQIPPTSDQLQDDHDQWDLLDICASDCYSHLIKPPGSEPFLMGPKFIKKAKLKQKRKRLRRRLCSNTAKRQSCSGNKSEGADATDEHLSNSQCSSSNSLNEAHSLTQFSNVIDNSLNSSSDNSSMSSESDLRLAQQYLQSRFKSTTPSETQFDQSNRRESSTSNTLCPISNR